MNLDLDLTPPHGTVTEAIVICTTNRKAQPRVRRNARVDGVNVGTDLAALNLISRAMASS